MLPIIVFLESFHCSESDTFPMTQRAFVEVFFHLFAYFLWFEMYGFDNLAAVTTIKCHFSAFRIECTFTFFPERRNIDKVGIGSGHDKRERR